MTDAPITWGRFVFLGLTLAAVPQRLHLPPFLSEWHINRLAVLRSLRASLP